jgi:putative transcriptional regulator
LVALGYAGWDAGQLEREVSENAWLCGPADSGIIFNAPYEERWDRAARLLGIDPDRLSGEAGHA